MIIIRNIKWNRNNKNLPTIMTVPISKVTMNPDTLDGCDIAWFLANTTGFTCFPDSFNFEVR